MTDFFCCAGCVYAAGYLVAVSYYIGIADASGAVGVMSALRSALTWPVDLFDRLRG